MSFFTTNPYLYTGNEAWILSPGQQMKDGEYLMSPGGAWRLWLQANNFCYQKDVGALFIYKIAEDKTSQVMASKTFPASRSCHLALEGGFLRVREGHKPGQGNILWSVEPKQKPGGRLQLRLGPEGFLYTEDAVNFFSMGGYTTPGVYEMSDIEYDYAHMTKGLNPTVAYSASKTVTNGLDKDQKQSVEFTLTKSQEHSWENTSTQALVLKVHAKLKAPGAECGFEIGGEFTESSAKGEVKKEETKETYKVELDVPAHSKARVDVIIMKTTAKLPYRAKGCLLLGQNGKSYVELPGTFVIGDASDVHVTYTKLEASGSGASPLRFARQQDSGGAMAALAVAERETAEGETLPVPPENITIVR